MSEEEKIGKLTLGEIRALKVELKNMIENAVAGEIRAFEQEHGIEVADASVFVGKVAITAESGEKVAVRYEINTNVQFIGEEAV